MKKNHFFTSYEGNKREEVKHIYDTVKARLPTIKNIVEPFCGSSALSYYISTLHPKQYTYYLNDIDKYLIDLYIIFKDEEKTTLFLNEINEFLRDDITKAKYLSYINKDNYKAWFLKYKIYMIRPGLFPLNYKHKDITFNNTPIINFIRNENIIFSSIDAIDIYAAHVDNKESFLFLDPPYVDTCTAFYTTRTNMNIYEYINNNNFLNKNALVLFCLENSWFCRILFSQYENKTTYDKLYQRSKKRTTHIIIKN